MRITAISRHPWRGLRRPGALAGAAMLTAIAAALASASPPAQAALGHRAGAGTPRAISSLTTLYGVSADSATDAWAVGYYDNSGGGEVPLTEHWNGTAWKTVTAPVPSGATQIVLQGVSAVSATDAWAVGSYQNSSGTLPLIERWNGTAWKAVTAPVPSKATGADLLGVSAVSATDAWAVGYYDESSGDNVPLTEHWNGTAWKTVTAPDPSGATYPTLQGVSAISATDAWAVGGYSNSSNTWKPLILKWNGSAWTQASVTAPDEGALKFTSLSAVSAISATDAWAVGQYNNSSNVEVPLTEHWNGTAWKTVTAPAPSGAMSTVLQGVSAVSATDAWAAGYSLNSSDVQVPLILRWNGTAWKAVTTPAPSGATLSTLTGVSAVSATDAWAVGAYNNSSGVNKSLILRWNGTAWKKVTSPNGP
jgi:hypothetical protein